MSALSVGSSGCSDDSRGVCAAAPSLASRVCRATCGVCDGYGVPPEEARRSAVPVACPAASAPPSLPPTLGGLTLRVPPSGYPFTPVDLGGW